MPFKRRGEPAAPRGGYQEWAEYLDQWGAGGRPDGSALGPLDAADFPGDAWARLVDRVTAAINRRLEAWQTALSRATDAAFSSEFEYGRALQQGRDGLHPVRALAADPRFPEDLRTRLTELVDGQLREMQKQLEDHVQRQRGRGDSARLVEARLLTLRGNAFTAVTTQALQGTAEWSPPPEGLPRKRVIQR